jgi:hypothetical protein
MLGAAFTRRICAVPELGAVVSSVRTIGVMPVVPVTMTVVLVLSARVIVVSTIGVAEFIGSTCIWREPELTEMYPVLARYARLLFTVVPSTIVFICGSFGAASKTRRFAVPLDPQPMVAAINNKLSNPIALRM